MESEAWRSVDVVRNQQGEPHVRQQQVQVYADGVTGESAGHTKPLVEHRLVPLTDVTTGGE